MAVAADIIFWPFTSWEKLPEALFYFFLKQMIVLWDDIPEEN